jgi:hydroxyethylthiazole kinase-like uncharacterized protein yjeF
MIELLTPAEMAEADRLTVEAGTPIATLMERAGYAVADAIAAECTYGVRIVVVAGPGDNGGDAFVAARVLADRGFAVAVVDMAGEGGREAARAARASYRRERIDLLHPAVARADIVIDGLFGAGLTRDVEGPFRVAVEAMNASRGRVFAVDIPSGIDGATGAVRGIAVEAARTVTFARGKPGHYLYPGRAHAGRVTIADIGIRDGAIAATGCRTVLNGPALWRTAVPRLASAGHKYDRGHAVVLSGPMLATGAARLAATAALRAGAGLVTLASPPDALLVNAAHLTTVMLARVDGPEAFADHLSDRRRNAVCLGPGLPPDEETAAMAEAALAAGAAVVLDAGAVVAFAGAVGRLAAAIRGPAVLTPHEGEFARVFGGEGDKLTRARRAAAETGAVVLLKGADTVVAAPDGRAAINANAPAWLATAGSGDVLAGIVTAFLAQGAPPFEAAAAAVFLHGDAGRHAGPALIADDLLAALKPARAALDEV